MSSKGLVLHQSNCVRFLVFLSLCWVRIKTFVITSGSCSRQFRSQSNASSQRIFQAITEETWTHEFNELTACKAETQERPSRINYLDKSRHLVAQGIPGSIRTCKPRGCSRISYWRGTVNVTRNIRPNLSRKDKEMLALYGTYHKTYQSLKLKISSFLLKNRASKTGSQANSMFTTSALFRTPNHSGSPQPLQWLVKRILAVTRQPNALAFQNFSLVLNTSQGHTRRRHNVPKFSSDNLPNLFLKRKTKIRVIRRLCWLSSAINRRAINNCFKSHCSCFRRSQNYRLFISPARYLRKWFHLLGNLCCKCKWMNRFCFCNRHSTSNYEIRASIRRHLQKKHIFNVFFWRKNCVNNLMSVILYDLQNTVRIHIRASWTYCR